MAQSTILAAGTTVATSSSVTIAAGSAVTVGIFVASGNIPVDCSFLVNLATPGATIPLGSLGKMSPTMVIAGPGAVTVTRNSAGGAGTSVGVFADTGVGVPVAGTAAANGTADNPIGVAGRDPNGVSLRYLRASTLGDLYTEGGSTVSKLASAAATNNSTNMKSSAGKLFAVQGFKATAAACWVKFYNKASAPTVGTDLPFISLYCPASSPFLFTYHGGIQFSTGIGYAIVTGTSETDNTAVAAGDILNLNILYT